MSLITDGRVFEEGHVPQDIRHRNAESDALSATLRPILDGEPPEPALVTGPSGAGKSCTSRYLIRQLRRERPDLVTHHHNCWEQGQRASVLESVLGAFGTVVHRQSTPTDVMLTQLREASRDRPGIVILDEADQLDDTEILYEFARTENLGLILIGHSEADLFEGVATRTVTRLSGARTVAFDRYTLPELTSILRDRADAGLEGGCVADEHLREIADLAAGNAHKAIHTLRGAARIADERGEDAITAACIDPGQELARETLWAKRRKYLNAHQRAILDVVVAAGEIAPRDLYERYRERVADPVQDRTVRNHLDKLAHYDMVRGWDRNALKSRQQG